jgi:hypothetical protein
VSPPPPVRELAEAHGADQAELTAAALAMLDQAARRDIVDPERWRDAVAAVAAQLLALQVAAAALAEPYVTAVLQAQGAAVLDGPAVNPEGFADMSDGAGSWTRKLVFAPIAVARNARARGLATTEARRSAQLVAGSIVLTGMQDTGRAAVQAAMWSRGAGWYVRMLNGTSCARCAVLAGRRYRSSHAFRRHPRCDCRMIPAAEDRDDWTTSPVDYFRSLSREDQDRVFTKAGAQAIRDTGVRQSAINQVVNARQGITTVRAYGRDIQITTVGTTKRALFGGYEILPDGTLRKRADSELRKLPGRRYRTAKAPRLLPDEIYRLAEEFGWDRAEVLRQLRRFAYVL